MKIILLRWPVAVGVTFVAVAHWSCLAMAKDCSGLNTQTEMNLCESGNFKQADAELNAIYAKLVSKISATGQSKLREAQKAWLKYRDAQCEFDTMGTTGGSIHSMMLWQCLTDLTAQQTKRLQHQLTCPEGDVSCGGQ